ncbi:MAG: hypothetical protein CEN88_364 [Candidatus Berkelbacteria bacterium Licking1014_2]|uniref:Uncharacterized protein n=1 Tax=Candidatus Berkelbacteria bacterium Licking1014_2 TaxID=2017146 RepID=A0A554LU41_9BACT|nr:MAG: hypothetical protein CEN88_364 [Candidatus Berkelbacteria bacterium Licking1014_2]
MNKTTGIIFGLVVILALLAGGGYLIWRVKNSQPEVVIVQYQPVDTDILSSTAVSRLSGRDANASLPIVVTKDDLGRDNPFINY